MDAHTHTCAYACMHTQIQQKPDVFCLPLWLPPLHHLLHQDNSSQAKPQHCCNRCQHNDCNQPSRQPCTPAAGSSVAHLWLLGAVVCIRTSHSTFFALQRCCNAVQLLAKMKLKQHSCIAVAAVYQVRTKCLPSLQGCCLGLGQLCESVRRHNILHEGSICKLTCCRGFRDCICCIQAKNWDCGQALSIKGCDVGRAQHRLPDAQRRKPADHATAFSYISMNSYSDC